MSAVTPAEVAMFRALAEKGMSTSQIAKHTGRSARTIQRYAAPNAPRVAPAVNRPLREKRSQWLKQAREAQAMLEAAHDKHVRLVLDVRPGGFPVAFARRARPLQTGREFWRNCA